MRCKDHHGHGSGTLFHGWVTFTWTGQGKVDKIHTFFSIQFQMLLAHIQSIYSFLQCQVPTIHHSVYNNNKDASLSSRNKKQIWENWSLARKPPLSPRIPMTVTACRPCMLAQKPSQHCELTANRRAGVWDNMDLLSVTIPQMTKDTQICLAMRVGRILCGRF